MQRVAKSSYPCDSASPAQARRWCVAFIEEYVHDPDAGNLLDSAALVVSELLTNALRAGCQSAGLEVIVEDESLRIAVTDDASGRPTPVAAAPQDEHGRGLHVVSVIASEWGVSQFDGSKVVWASLPRTRAG